MRLSFYGKEAGMVCACGCVYASRWVVRRVRGKPGFRINTESVCPECFRNYACYRTTTDPEGWDIRSTWGRGAKLAGSTAAADQSLHRAIAVACEQA